MAFELQCPECKAELRLASEPWPGTDVECPTCGGVFPAPDPREKGKGKKAKADDAPRKAKPSEEDAKADKDGAEKSGEKKPEEKKAGDKQTPKKRRMKKKKSNPAVLIFVGVFGAMVLGTVIAVLVWFFNRKPSAYEMMVYLPEDTVASAGANITHLQRYPKLWEKIRDGTKNVGYSVAAEQLAATTNAKGEDILDYVVWGESPSGNTLVLRLKDGASTPDLAKLPGASERKTGGGGKYYDVSGYAPSRGRMRVFSPAERIVVYCDATIPEPTFEKMYKGNADGGDKLITARIGPMGKRVVRGTFWWVQPLEKVKLTEPKEGKDGGNESGDVGARRYVASGANKGQGLGVKVTVGSRAVKVELVYWGKDSDAVAKQYESFKKDVLDKAEDEEPKWWKGGKSKLGGDKIARDLWTNMSAKTSGELFVVYSQVDTVIFLDGVGQVVTFITGDTPGGSGGPGGGPPGGGGPGGMPGGGPPGGGPGGPGGGGPGRGP